MALGTVARLVWVLIAAEPPGGGDPDVVPRDPGFYLLLGQNLANGDGYSYPNPADLSPEPVGYYPPGYPMAIGGLFWVAKLLPFDVTAFGVAIALNVVLSVATIALVFELGRRLVSVPVGLASAAVMAFWPNLIFHSGVVLTETLFLFLLVLMLLVALASSEVARAPGRSRMVTVGLLLGMIGMVRPTSFVLAPMLLLLWWQAGVVTAIRRTALVGAAMLVVILPWTARNIVQMDSPVLVSANLGDNICMGHRPGASGAFGMAPYCFDGLEGPERERGEVQGEFQIRRQSETLARARRYIREDPARVVTLMPAKARYTLGSDADGLDAATDYDRQQLFADSTMGLLEGTANVYYAAVIVVGLAGVVVLLRRDDAARRGVFLVAVAVIQLVPPLLTFGDARFKMPIYPTVAVCVGLALVAVFDRMRRPTASVEPEQDEGGETGETGTERQHVTA